MNIEEEIKEIEGFLKERGTSEEEVMGWDTKDINNAFDVGVIRTLREVKTDFEKPIKAVLDMYYEDEMKHWLEADKPREHIFNDLKNIKELIA